MLWLFKKYFLIMPIFHSKKRFVIRRKYFFLGALILLTPLAYLTHSLVYAQSAQSDRCVTKVGDPDSAGISPIPTGCISAGSAGVCQKPPPLDPGTPLNPGTNILDEIKSKWGITLINIPQEQQEAIREIFYEVDCTGFLQDIKGTVVKGTGIYGGVSRQVGCPQEAGYDVEFSVYSYPFTKGLIIHELTHVWQMCSQRGEANKMLIPDAFWGEGGISRYSRNECSLQVGDNWQNEDHADTIALYVNQDYGELTCGEGTTNPYANGGKPLHRNVAQKGLGI